MSRGASHEPTNPAAAAIGHDNTRADATADNCFASPAYQARTEGELCGSIAICS
jgi:hypothetical protein